MSAISNKLAAHLGVISLTALTVLALLAWRISDIQPVAVRGIVVTGEKPIAGARVRWQGNAETVLTDKLGRYSLPVSKRKTSRLTAWKKGYAIGATANHSPFRILLSPLPLKDNEDYHWIDPAPNPQKPNQCANCHGEIYKEWKGSAHGHSAANRRFLDLFGGENAKGKATPRWNLLNEHPLGAGVCATCHAPTFRDPKLFYDMRKITGVAAQGVHCDYCHKIVDVSTRNLGITFGNDGHDFLRPKNEQALFFGPLDDAFRDGEMFAYSPLYKQSRYCASCHEGIVFGVHVYGTYSEWLKSPARQQDKHCQDCHMKPTGNLTNIAPGKGGIERDPRTLASHDFTGATKQMLQHCLKLESKLQHGKDVVVEVKITARNVGHMVPTGFIQRNLVLVVEGFDALGKRSALRRGSTLPSAAGQALAGLPGKLYAKLLFDREGRAPIPFWLPHGKIIDTRLHPDRPVRQQFTFPAAAREVRVRLIYRRFWPEVYQNKGWPDDAIVVVDRKLR